MFGGLAIYYQELMVSVLMESPGDRAWRGEEYDFDIWNGIMLCTSREHHPSLKQSLLTLTHHPVLGKWLYLPMNTETFESDLETVVQFILKGDNRIGIVPGTKKRKSKAKGKKEKK